MKNVTELFAPPVGADVVARIDGEPYYGSERLSLNFLESMRESSHAKPLYDTIEKLVSSGNIVPCWMNKNILKLIKFRVTASESVKNGVAFFVPKTNKVFVLIDNNINKWGFASNNWIAIITIHEMCHLLAKKKPSAFISTYSPILKEYYSYLFKRIFQLESLPDTSKFVKFLFKNFELVDYVKLSNLNKYYELIMEWKDDSAFDAGQYQGMAFLLINCIKIRHINFNAWYMNISNFDPVLKPMSQAYEDLIGNVFKGVNTNVFQELDVPSEVIAIMSEVKSPYYSNILKGLKQL